MQYMNALARDLDLGAGRHGFQSSFRDWAAECTEAPHILHGDACCPTVRKSWRLNPLGDIELKPSEVIREGDVLVATIRFLLRNGSTPTRISVARGKGMKATWYKKKVERVFRDEKSDKPTFANSGPDIEAVSNDLYWKIECKGSGTGQPATQRNNFDRALASVVSYYEDRPPAAVECAKNAKVALGLALPASEQYLKHLSNRAGPPLRRRLNLWVLLYDHRKIQPIRPNEPIPGAD